MRFSAAVTPQFVLNGRTLDELMMAAVSFLVAEGFIVERAGEWESREDFCRRLNISVWHFRRRWRYRRLGPTIEVETGKSGRLIRLRSNAAFDRWMSR